MIFFDQKGGNGSIGNGSKGKNTNGRKGGQNKGPHDHTGQKDGFEMFAFLHGRFHGQDQTNAFRRVQNGTQGQRCLRGLEGGRTFFGCGGTFVPQFTHHDTQQEHKRMVAAIITLAKGY